MRAPQILSLIAIGLSLAGISLLTALDTNVQSGDLIGLLNSENASHQALANGLFLLLGIFWMGAVDSTRRFIEPRSLDSWLRFSAIGFAASYLFSMLFPCDNGCLPGASVSQMVHSSVLWLLYCGPAVFAGRLLWGKPERQIRHLAALLLLVFAVLQLDAFVFQASPGLWQRIYELLFCWLWWLSLHAMVKADSAQA
ncbi:MULTISPECIES: hypothetical protein [Reinekea]|uniref:Conserved hypothetical membrane protein n=1 Tax=Reinekea forsetii TaxID=1336806 RepID=A0A2K8KSM9_9GAMM|nr:MULTISPECIES: hypothetical protein [Reinekea]ATX77713.1 conserved hypothetical membrane protein [Reinekea forsetii]MDO7641643.1 hypothetical protein [Reinekea forsetii]MDO7644390.1 hypothetical protein [Reinekea forsetii]